MTEELKPCPACDAEMRIYTPSDFQPCYTAVCTNVMCGYDVDGSDTLEGIIELANRRPAIDALHARIAELEATCEAAKKIIFRA